MLEVNTVVVVMMMVRILIVIRIIFVGVVRVEIVVSLARVQSRDDD